PCGIFHGPPCFPLDVVAGAGFSGKKFFDILGKREDTREDRGSPSSVNTAGGRRQSVAEQKGQRTEESK
ncbi:hypothetical protein C5745_20015, partial [Sphingobacterium haloxyli]